MDNPALLLLGNYKQLVGLFEKQAAIAEQVRYDEQLEQIREIEEKKEHYKAAIEQLSLNHAEYAAIIAEHGNKVAAYLERLQSLNEQLQSKITDWYSEDSRAMKQVSDQRRTLQSYGGVNNSDVISYYFDEKQ